MRIKRSIPVSALCILIALSLTSCISVRKVSDEEIRAGFDELCDDILSRCLKITVSMHICGIGPV